VGCSDRETDRETYRKKFRAEPLAAGSGWRQSLGVVHLAAAATVAFFLQLVLIWSIRWRRVVGYREVSQPAIEATGSLRQLITQS